MKHSETEKDYLVKESELMKVVSVAEFELDGLMQVSGILPSCTQYMVIGMSGRRITKL